jgi:HK97 family phage portal protein
VGILDALGLTGPTEAAVTAAAGPSTPGVHLEAAGWYPGTLPWPVWPAQPDTNVFTVPLVTREAAMSVPAVARARNVIAGTIASLPLHLYDLTGTRIPEPLWLRQPDPSIPRPVTLAWTVEDLIFHGVAYWQVIDVFAEDGRPRHMRRLDPYRVSYRTDDRGLNVVEWMVDGIRVPMSGLSSLVVFPGIDEGVLRRAGRTIKAAVELERAALRYAEEPLPSVVIRNEGVDLPDDQVERLLARWKVARNTRQTAYLSSQLKAEPMGFSPEQLQLVAAREHLAGELARLMNIPARYVGASSGDSMTYSNTTQQRRDLVDFSLRPFLEVIEERLTMDDVTTRGQAVSFALDDFLRSEPMERAQFLTAMVAAGIYTIEEARQLEQLADRAPGAPL